MPNKDYFLNVTPQLGISANCFYIQLGKKGFVFDAGMDPKAEGYDATPHLEWLDHRPLDAIFLSHAHHDHTGAIPLIQLRNPDAKVFMTAATAQLAEPLLHNSVNVMKRNRLAHGIMDYPLYTHQDIDRVKERWHGCGLQTPWSIEGFPIKEKDSVAVKFRMHHAGHILGSAAIEIEVDNQTILYTGDFNCSDQTLLKKASLPQKKIDILIIETTRGSHPTPEGFSRKQERRKFIEALNKTYDKGGSALIPIFAMGKTQETISMLHLAQTRGELPTEPIYIGGLGRVFTSIYDNFAQDSPRYHPDLNLLQEIQPQVVNWKKLDDFKSKRGHLYLIPSGMMTPHTTSNRLATYFLSREQNSIYFVGYTDPETPAGRLRATPSDQRITLNHDYGDQPILCNIEHFDFTSHANREDILYYIRTVNPRKCFLVHGDLEATQWFQSKLVQSHPNMNIHVPEPGVEISL
ncbi:MAG: MBL fold metallo-hydrolase [Verrucomicrobiota bacterium]